MDLKLTRCCNGVRNAQVKYKGFCYFSWDLISHYKDVLLVRLLVSLMSPLHNFHIPLSCRLPTKICSFSCLRISKCVPVLSLCSCGYSLPSAQGLHGVYLSAEVSHVILFPGLGSIKSHIPGIRNLPSPSCAQCDTDALLQGNPSALLL